jgi:hypothetical protein
LNDTDDRKDDRVEAQRASPWRAAPYSKTKGRREWRPAPLPLQSRCKQPYEMLAGRQGVFARASEDPNKDWSFQHNSHEASELAFSDSFVGFHLFASIFGFCKCNDTRNVTRRERLPEFSCQRILGNRSAMMLAAKLSGRGIDPTRVNRAGS